MVSELGVSTPALFFYHNLKLYTMIFKRHIKDMVKCANELLAQTKDTQILYNIYADSCYILDNEEDNIIDVLDSEEDAIETCAAINSGEYSDDGHKGNCYYKPVLIDIYTGEKITRKNFEFYKIKTNQPCTHS